MIGGHQHTSVLIVGAGPSGLMMAAQLLRYGIQPVVIDSKTGPTHYTKALAVQARSLEIYRQMGMVDSALDEGKQAQGITFNQHGEVLASLSFAGVGEKQTRFPFILFYPQSKNERLLLDELTTACCPVYWSTSLIKAQQTGGKVTVTASENGRDHTLTCDWLIGADGAGSTVRKQMGTPFNGDTYPNKFYLADVKLAGVADDNIQLYLEKNGLAAFFPLPEAGAFRIIGDIPQNFEDNDDLKLDDILPSLNKVTAQNISIIHCNWFTTYKLHHRMAAQFRQQHCFLIGDAAHVHSPVGGQGMNTGLQDAYNLAWKLAAVINNQIAPSILDSYETERMPVAKQLLRTTDRAFNIITASNWATSFFKISILPHLIKFMWSKPGLREKLFRTISQTGISYRDSRINLHLSQLSTIKAGDRLPYVEIFDERTQQQTDLHAWCSKPGFTLLVLGKFKEIDIFTLAKWITQKYNGAINLFYLPPSKNNIRVFELFGIKEEQKKAIIVRPDMYIGYINDVVAIDMMDNYLLNVIHFNPSLPSQGKE
ncbi:FAD-dependent monooxygenase [Mucilaginibacter sp. UR6-1]|uniref:FAD-dependent oxidoreductase n=1 Tax=Mucilaginibacter sp. UR6-1 TaxID=1435643 RepID=UPI001E326F25|nr:FAD-dependent monooxygenase [Mucilaginibacter sp. UR6-1]MCC8411232.1 FAD-dependent monooxygenase [Mucilaginibacter sp. UR6-1]